MRKTILVSSLVVNVFSAAMFVSPSAVANLVKVDSEVIQSTRDCTGLAFEADCSVIAPSIFMRTPASDIDQTQSISGGFGLSSSQVRISDSGTSIALSVNMESAANTRNGATAKAIQSFTWLGANNSSVPFAFGLTFKTTPLELTYPDVNTQGQGGILLELALVDLGVFDTTTFIPTSYLGLIGCGDSGLIGRDLFTINGNVSDIFAFPIAMPRNCDGSALQLQTGVHYGLLTTVASLGNRGATGSATLDVKFTGNTADLGKLNPPNAPNAVPEPAAFMLFGLGMAVFFVRNRRQLAQARK